MTQEYLPYYNTLAHGSVSHTTPTLLINCSKAKRRVCVTNRLDVGITVYSGSQAMEWVESGGSFTPVTAESGMHISNLIYALADSEPGSGTVYGSAGYVAD